jgi:hypothetical protein
MMRHNPRKTLNEYRCLETAVMATGKRNTISVAGVSLNIFTANVPFLRVMILKIDF